MAEPSPVFGSHELGFPSNESRPRKIRRRDFFFAPHGRCVRRAKGDLRRNGTLLVSPARMTQAIPAIVNRASRGSAEAIRILTEDGGYEGHEVGPDEIPDGLRDVIVRNPSP